MEAIILAGGLGTRLQGVIGTYPKCMAPVNGKPFLSYIFDYLERHHCTRVILSLGYKHRVITDWLETQDLYFEVDYVIEQEPLGTGGGILAAAEEAFTDHVVVLNGDTMFKADLREQMAFHKASNAETTLALKPMHDFDRYGIVEAGKNGLITAFHEKEFCKQGLINGGVYIIDREQFLAREYAEKFSFEKEYLEKYVGEKKFYGYTCNDYFIDIGIPADYERSQTDLKTLFS